MDNNLSLSLRGPNGAAAIRNPTTKKRIQTVDKGSLRRVFDMHGGS